MILAFLPIWNQGGETTNSHSAKLFWSLAPLRISRPAETKIQGWSRTPIDSFILARLEASGMKPAPPADRTTLLRRVSFDLVGLPPTPQDLKDFLADDSPGAYEKVVDRLLASPRYGERWARHWLDIVHYAETHGNDQDRVRTNAWPYRDYVIQSFNEDKPYARFVQEQIAGDVIFPKDPQATVAMGFLATGPWDESSLRDIRDDTIDRQIARYLDRDDIVTTVMNTFVSTTVQCARCHNHKFDPISHQEYYALQAVFASTDKGNRFYDPDPKIHERRQTLRQKQKDVDKRSPSALAELTTPEFQARLVVWEKSVSDGGSLWMTLEPTSFASKEGATLQKQPDGSILSAGKRPDKDTYTIEAAVAGPRVTGVRVEVLCDEALPQRGPGRQDNGNLHLTEFRVFASGGSTAKPLAIRSASADFNQKDWGIEKAIDGNPETAWGIYPEVGKPHQALFEFAEPYHSAPGTKLRFVLEQNHGGGHLIGRVRISATDSERPTLSRPFPDSIASILGGPVASRTLDEQRELGLYFQKKEIEEALAALPPPQLVYAGANDFVPDNGFKPAAGLRPVHLLQRGDINRPGPVAEPGALSCVTTLPSRFNLSSDDEGARRSALAQWITDPRNPLTWRSIANRIWHYHFGRGIVDSPNDLGHMGSAPSHPELLDWLAVQFQAAGGSFKEMDRLIVTSSTYRQSTAHNAQYAERDADNRLLWRMNRTRLDAESVRDAILQISGNLDLAMGGPSVQQFVMTPGIHVTPNVDYSKFNVDSPENNRRSIYRFIFRTLPDPFMDTLDCADSSQLTAARNVSVTPLQALAMMNDRFIVKQSERFATRLEKSYRDPEAQIGAACQLVFHRDPRPDELVALSAYAKKHGLANLCRLIFNSNEFMFVN